MNSDRINRRDLIIDTAANLFQEQGYNATSVRQIADAVGVTEAALYYHFKAGKRELLEAVIECKMPEFEAVVEFCKDAQSLTEVIVIVSKNMQTTGREGMERLRWIIAEFSNLSDEERALFHKKHIAFQDALTQQVARFVDDETLAHHITLTVICTMLGYGQLFWNLQMETVVDFTPIQAIKTLSEMLKVFEK